MTQDEKDSVEKAINSMKTIGTFCEKCRMPYCICKNASTIIKDLYSIDIKYDWVHNDGKEVEELANEQYFLTKNEAMNWLYNAQKDGEMEGYCLELKTYYFPAGLID